MGWRWPSESDACMELSLGVLQVSVSVSDQVLAHGETGTFEELFLQHRGVYFRIFHQGPADHRSMIE